jgi:tRNA U34 2-thiouridine synthase MnmA/TrmU
MNGRALDNYAVIAIDARSGNIMLGLDQSCYSPRLFAKELNWIDAALSEGDRITAKVCHWGYELDARIERIFDAEGSGGCAEIFSQGCVQESVQGTAQNGSGNRIEISFNKPARAVTPGQYVVFYHGDEVLGGACIERSE